MSLVQEDLPPGVTREGDDEPPSKPSVPTAAPYKIPKPLLNCTWTNEASELNIATYFDPERPNLATDYNIDGLQPVIKQVQGDLYLLTDSLGKFYRWSDQDGQIWQMTEPKNVQDAMDGIMRDSSTLKSDPKNQKFNLDTLD